MGNAEFGIIAKGSKKYAPVPLEIEGNGNENADRKSSE